MANRLLYTDKGIAEKWPFVSERLIVISCKLIIFKLSMVTHICKPSTGGLKSAAAPGPVRNTQQVELGSDVLSQNAPHPNPNCAFV